MFNVGDLVTRISHDNDVIFKIEKIDNDIAYLKGINVRLCADSDLKDLLLATKTDNNEDNTFFERVDNINAFERSDYFYIPGKILHIDSDISLSNGLANPYKIREKAKNENNINHQKNKKMSKI